MPKPVNKDGRYCDIHKRHECTAHAKRNEDHICHMAVGPGDHLCRIHRGISGEVWRAQREAATAFRVSFGEFPVDPTTMIKQVITMTYLKMLMYNEQLENQVEQDATTDTHGGVSPVAAHNETGGIVGYTFGPTGRVTGEAPRGLVIAEAAERERLARFIKVAHDMGIDEREIRVAETQAAVMVQLIQSVMGGLSLTQEQAERVPQLLQQEMMRRQLIAGEIVP